MKGGRGVAEWEEVGKREAPDMYRMLPSILPDGADVKAMAFCRGRLALPELVRTRIDVIFVCVARGLCSYPADK
jgi:hypothetical protein